MELATIGHLSADREIVETLGIVQYRTQESLNAKGLIERFIPTGNRDYTERDAFNYLEQSARRLGGNAVIGLQVSSTTATFSNGTFLYTTYIGTVVRAEKIKQTED